MRTWTAIRAALRNVAIHPLRSALTSIGIVAGVAAVVMVSSIAEGTRAEIRDTIEALGANRIDVNSGTMDGTKNATLLFGGLYQLDDRDVAEIRKGVRGVTSVSGFLRGSVDATFGRSKATLSWIGSNSDAISVLGYQLARGRGFTEAEGASGRRIALLGAGSAARLLGAGQRLDSRIRMGDTTFAVIGILQPRGLSVSGQNVDDVVIVPVKAARRQMMGDYPLPHGALQQIGVRLADVGERQESEAAIERLLRSKRKLSPGETSDFVITSTSDTVRARTKAERSMSFLLIAVATISLVVGGIGVMNIMLVTISERVGEIGLRMALGASPGCIRRQFLAESMLLSVAGGIVGGILGVGGAYGLAVQQQMPTQISMSVLITAVAVTVMTGLVFGLWPAYQAARMRPVDALRRL